MGSSVIKSATRVALRLMVCMAAIGASLPVQAQQVGLMVIGNDRGGQVGARASEIDRIRALGTRVEIRGQICYSACTMYLGAGNVCVDPTTRFGFHGPSDYGSPLPPDRFDHWSRVMARYYNEPVRQWFMADARYQQQDMYQISGTQLISLGYSQC